MATELSREAADLLVGTVTEALTRGSGWRKIVCALGEHDIAALHALVCSVERCSFDRPSGAGDAAAKARMSGLRRVVVLVEPEPKP